VVELRGRLVLPEAEALWQELSGATDGLARGSSARFDLSHLEHAEGAGIAVLLHVQGRLTERGVDVVVSGASPNLTRLMAVYASAPSRPVAGRVRATGALARAGRSTVELLDEVRQWLGFVVLVTIEAVGRRRGPSNWKDLPPLMERAGADAVPIIIVLNFLVGLVMAYESAIQLKRFGATIYVADLVGLSIAREFGPLMTSIIVAGRSGAAIAAELGTMNVSEEIDALRAMNLEPVRFLVFPRVVALLLMVPLLTLVGDAMGMVGGLTVATLALDITRAEYFSEMKTIVFASDIFLGVLKSVAFALAIGLIACQQGLRATAGASSVGRRTTSAVVSILCALILIDALFAPFFRGHHN